jgi:hypothetical protein
MSQQRPVTPNLQSMPLRPRFVNPKQQYESNHKARYTILSEQNAQQKPEPSICKTQVCCKQQPAPNGTGDNCGSTPDAHSTAKMRRQAGSKPKRSTGLPAVLQLPVEGAKQTHIADQHTYRYTATDKHSNPQSG